MSSYLKLELARGLRIDHFWERIDRYAVEIEEVAIIETGPLTLSNRLRQALSPVSAHRFASDHYARLSPEEIDDIRDLARHDLRVVLKLPRNSHLSDELRQLTYASRVSASDLEVPAQVWGEFQELLAGTSTDSLWMSPHGRDWLLSGSEEAIDRYLHLDVPEPLFSTAESSEAFRIALLDFRAALVDWLSGRVAESEAAFSRIATPLAANFETVSQSGVVGRDDWLIRLRTLYRHRPSLLEPQLFNSSSVRFRMLTQTTGGPEVALATFSRAEDSSPVFSALLTASEGRVEIHHLQPCLVTESLSNC